jgi:hypothetical protein
MMIWSNSVCIRRGGLAGEEGGFRRRVGGCEGGVVDPRLVRDGVFTLGPCVAWRLARPWGWRRRTYCLRQKKGV